MGPQAAPLDYGDYTVAIICPMGVELAPVLAMLDERHASLESQGQASGHILGRIGEHMVVVSVLPEIGTNRAATVSAQLVNDFPSLKFGLLVGIGGGIPSPASDIRLGDVVVSKPTAGSPGVVQFDMGKIEAGGSFRRTGYLAKPPPALLTAMETLIAKFEMNGPKLGKAVEEMLLRHPAMKDRYSYQDAANDILYKASYEHSTGDTCASCDDKKQVRRAVRPSSEPRIFYGLIGSSNVVVKNGVYRESLEEEGLLCVEMEAAGMMDNFGCLVIRGICDYADSHKNKRWQPYAAATAAAFMKEILYVLPRSAVRREYDQSRRGMLVFAIFGQGGSGKTSLCLKYAWEFRDQYVLCAKPHAFCC
ncbi:pfs domain-containing protein [Elsinoe ampelina]|uniref:Pfs domain-containing protein n=1 Tax=Elsinoe ampelina TaxID=302913 RepID=A0A6A6GDI1_9PEZI|nr:pfs domain-containing protein [Elsinoe ampelina]